MTVLIRSRVLSTRWPRLMLVLAAFLPECNLPAEPVAPLQSAQSSPVSMKTFVIIFRQTTQPLTEADKQRRAEETSAWARRQNDAGHKLDPHSLAPESAHGGLELAAVTHAKDWPITALLFLEAHDLAEAAQIAESHPALRFGGNVEVRPWGRPVAVAPAAGASTRP